jgi:hypothetical protein
MRARRNFLAMTPRISASIALALGLLFSLSAAAQVGIPGSGPLTPDGPRRGLSPPSITDNVPDLRLQTPSGVGGGGGYNPAPIYQGGGYQRSPNRALSQEPRRRTGRHCETPRRSCAMSRSAYLGTDCSCRTSKGRVRGSVVR